MSRSLKVAPQLIKQVKLAVKRNGFYSLQSLAEHLGMAKSTISNFLNGKPVDFVNFAEICETLSLNWQAIAHLESETAINQEPLLKTFQESPDSLFAEAAHKWDLEKLFTDMAVAKGSFAGKPPKQLTFLEMLLLKGLLCGYKPSEIGANLPKRNKSRKHSAITKQKEGNENKKNDYKWIYVYLSRGLYQYIKELLAAKMNQVIKIDNWTQIPILLEKAGYRLASNLDKPLQDSSSKARFLISCEVEEEHLKAIITFFQSLPKSTYFKVEKIFPIANANIMVAQPFDTTVEKHDSLSEDYAEFDKSNDIEI